MSIRKFIGLDKATIELDNDFVDAVGLIIVEKKDFMKIPQICFVGFDHSVLPVKHTPDTGSHLHFPVDFHS